MGQKNTQLPSFERVQHLKEKSRAKSFLTIVNRAVEKVYLCKRKKLGGKWHFIVRPSQQERYTGSPILMLPSQSGAQ